MYTLARGTCCSLKTLTLLLLLPFTNTFVIASDLTRDHNHHRIDPDLNEVDWGLGHAPQDTLSHSFLDREQVWDGESAAYQAEFPSWGPGAERSIIGRAVAGVTALSNGQTSNSNISPGETISFVLEQTQIFGSTPRAYNSLVAAVLGPNADVKNVTKRSVPVTDGDLDVVGQEDQNVHESAPLEARQQQSRTVYISVNTCLQPSTNGSGSVGSAVPQLTLYLSTDNSNQKPGPGQGTKENNIAVPLVQGYASFPVPTTGNVYIGVNAPSASGTGTGGWNFAVAASIDFPNFYFNSSTSLAWALDTDSTGALLSTTGLTSADLPSDVAQAWASATPPMSLFVYNQSDPALDGILNSYCGLQQRLGSSTVNVTSAVITPDGPTNEQRQRFHVTKLSPGQDYSAILAYKDQSVNQVWQPINFTTKTDGNCALIYDLPFCSSIAYAVPTNGTLDTTTLAQTYDNNTQTYYQNFTYSLQQIACTIDNTSQYSLQRTCADCDKDYRTWLCAVTIPRCTDLSLGNMSALNNAGAITVPRGTAYNFTNGSTPDLVSLGFDTNITNILRYNSSRNPWIDTTFVPGPYQEILPCRNTCYEIVKSCPASLQFSCPAQERLFNRSYGIMPDSRGFVLGMETCNYPGFDWVAYQKSGVGRAFGSEIAQWAVALIAMVVYLNT